MSKYTVYNKARFFGFLWRKKNHGNFATLEDATSYVSNIIKGLPSTSNVRFTIIPDAWENEVREFDANSRVIPIRRG